jgi:ketosteroid isomerase-like protein
MSQENVEIVRRGYDAYERGNDHQVIVRVHQTARGAQSGAPIEADFWFVHTVRDERVTRLDMFTSKAKALEVAGLGE